MDYTPIYNKLLDNLAAAVDSLEYIDWFNEQLLETSEELPFRLPAVFIEFPPGKATTSGNQTQLVDQDINVYLMTESLLDSSSLIIQAGREDALAHNELAQDIVTALLGFNNSETGLGSMSHRGNVSDHKYDAFSGTMIQFRSMVTVIAAMPETVEADPSLKIIRGRCY